nr:MAG TPA: hypothetical protein [Caudoviricetes sp.]
MDTKLWGLTTQHTRLRKDSLTIGSTTLRKKNPRLLATNNGNQIRSNDLQVLQRVALDLSSLAVLNTNLVNLSVALSNLSESGVSDQHETLGNISRVTVTQGSKCLEPGSNNRIKRQFAILTSGTKTGSAASDLTRQTINHKLGLVDAVKHVTAKRLSSGVKQLKEDQQVLSTRSESSSILRETTNYVPLVINKRLEAELDASTVLGSRDKRTIGTIGHGRVRGQLRHMRQRAHRVLIATIVDRSRSSVRLQRQKRSRTEVRQQLLRRNLVPNRLMSIEILLETNVRGLHEHRCQLIRGDSLLQARLRETVACKGLTQLDVELFLVLETHFSCLLSGVLSRRKNNLHLLGVGRRSKRLLQPTDNNISTSLNGRNLRLGATARRSLRIHRRTGLSISNRLADQLKHTTSDTHRGVARAVQPVGRGRENISKRCRVHSNAGSLKANLRLKDTSNAVILVNDNNVAWVKVGLLGINRKGESLRVLKNLVVVDNRNTNRLNRHYAHQPIFP